MPGDIPFLIPRVHTSTEFQYTNTAILSPCVVARCQAKFLTYRHARMHRVIFYVSNMLRKLIIMA